MKITNLGFPNAFGLKIKTAVEAFWKRKANADDISKALQEVSAFNASAQARLDLKPVFDIDIYDRLLKTSVIFGIVPKRFGATEPALNDVGLYLSIARGTKIAQASSMVKWFNTNYHVIQPEIEFDPILTQTFSLPVLQNDQKLCLIGPWTLLSYSINKTDQPKEMLFEKLCEQYELLINKLPESSIVQLEEPSFITEGFPKGYSEFVRKLKAKIHLHVYFEAVNEFAEDLFALPVEGIGLDFIDGRDNVTLLPNFPKDKTLIAGIVNGRNVWPVSQKTRDLLNEIQKHILDDKLYISPSCSLMHVPISAQDEKEDFSFALEKIQELEEIKNGTVHYTESLVQTDELPKQRFERKRKNLWVSSTPYPTSTIGSFPQTPELRSLRKKIKDGLISQEKYEDEIKSLIKVCIRRQEELGLDVLVHGEFERPDMVEYFAENLEGMTQIKGWVQSYGTRYIRPPIITGPIKRIKAFTVPWSMYAQSLTNKPVKGMLTGPVTIVEWSFPREDISREAQYYDIASALKDEVNDLVNAGINHIQIDEPAIREGLPLNKKKRDHYLWHAINAFRLVYSEATDETVVYSHICFSEFSDIMDAIQDMGMDVLSIEDSRSKGKVANTIRQSGFKGSIGLGVFDVHSPRIPTVEEILEIPRSLNLDRRHVWINPDCGLKTRGEEAYQQLEQMMKAVAILRQE